MEDVAKEKKKRHDSLTHFLSLSHSLTHTLSFTHTHTHSPSHYMSSEIILEMQRCPLLQLLIQVLERTPVEMIKKRGQRLLGSGVGMSEILERMGVSRAQWIQIVDACSVRVVAFPVD